MSAESSSQEREIWPEPEGKGLPDILVGEGRKVSAEEVGKEGGELVGVVKFEMMGAMSEY